ncbi:MAG TPA: substrate-binding domain-containing protein [Caldimonas sp.]|nr:substrate-binding domain-containing protein [Caldimonas sp.]HEX4233883.1 substrate-binding domain-containing protein [Caldimonas sp.]
MPAVAAETIAADLHLLCAGAVKGLVLAIQAGFEASAGARLAARFGAVGVMRDELAAGAPCDVFVATEPMVASLVAAGVLRAATSTAIGRVQTALAVPAGAAVPAIDNAEELRSTLLAASALYLPDAKRSTAGAHAVAVLDRLGIRSALEPRLRMHANGASAMAALAAAGDRLAVGCTQATEIRYTPGLSLVGPLPEPCALATVYSAAIATVARNEPAARVLVALLAGPASATLRGAGGFDPVALDAR